MWTTSKITKCEYGADGQLKSVEVKTLEQRIVDLEKRLEAAEIQINNLTAQLERVMVLNRLHDLTD